MSALDLARGRVREAGGDELAERLAHLDAARGERRAERPPIAPDRGATADFDVAIAGGGLSLLLAPLLAEILQAAIAISGADFGTIQIVELPAAQRPQERHQPEQAQEERDRDQVDQARPVFLDQALQHVDLHADAWWPQKDQHQRWAVRLSNGIHVGKSTGVFGELENQLFFKKFPNYFIATRRIDQEGAIPSARIGYNFGKFARLAAGFTFDYTHYLDARYNATAADGSFHLEGVPAGALELTALDVEHASGSSKITLGAGADAEIALALHPGE